jgi:hypothetical protein
VLRKFWLLFAQACTLLLAALFVVVTLRPDLTADMPEAYTPVATLDDDYRCFILDLDFPADTWIEGVDVDAGTSQVHHVLVYAMSGETLAAATAAKLPAGGFDLILSNEMAGDLPARQLSRADLGLAGVVPGSPVVPLQAEGGELLSQVGVLRLQGGDLGAQSGDLPP